MKLIGIDGGGTKTQMILCREDGTVLRQLKTGPSNPNDIGLENSFRLLFQNIRQLSQGEPECALFAGISGISTADRQMEFVQALKEEFPDYKVDCAGDMVTALSSGILHGDGAVIIAGTGVIGYGRKQGKIYRVGGYGYLLDPGGGGFNLGRDAFAAALEMGDGRGPKTILRPLLTEQLGQTPEDAIPTVYEKGKAYLASFAPLVFSACQQGDQTAQDILKNNTKEIANLIKALVLKMEVPLKIVVTGSLFRHFSLMEPFLSLPAGVSLLFSQRPQVFGAVVEAARIAGVPVEERFIQCFDRSYQPS